MNSSSTFRVLAGPGVTFLHETMFPSVSWLGPAGISAHASPFFLWPICCPRPIPEGHKIFRSHMCSKASSHVGHGAHSNMPTLCATFPLEETCRLRQIQREPQLGDWSDNNLAKQCPLMYIHIHDIGMFVVSLQKTIDITTWYMDSFKGIRDT